MYVPARVCVSDEKKVSRLLPTGNEPACLYH